MTALYVVLIAVAILVIVYLLMIMPRMCNKPDTAAFM